MWPKWPLASGIKCGCLNYDTPDGTGVRDYIHVMDLAEGHVRHLSIAVIATAQNC